MPAKKTQAAPKRRAPQKKAIRNIRYVPVSVRLESGKRIELKPRGMRGDCRPVTKDEISDPLFKANQDLLFEVINESEANDVQGKQETNIQAHPALAHIRNSRGEEYENAPMVKEEHEAQGVTVGNIDSRGNISRAQSNGTTDNPIREELTAEELDETARRTDLEGPAAGLGGLKVTKTDVQST